jgi:hypothetical protein
MDEITLETGLRRYAPFYTGPRGHALPLGRGPYVVSDQQREQNNVDLKETERESVSDYASSEMYKIGAETLKRVM